jgi:hypothetical protein
MVFAKVILWGVTRDHVGVLEDGVTLGEEPLIPGPEILGERGRELRLPSMTGGFSNT